MDNKLSRLKGLFDLGIFLFSVVIGTLTQKQVNISVCLGVKTCEVFLCLVAIVRIRVHYLDFFVLHHWWVLQVLTPRMSQIFSTPPHPLYSLINWCSLVTRISHLKNFCIPGRKITSTGMKLNFIETFIKIHCPLRVTKTFNNPEYFIISYFLTFYKVKNLDFLICYKWIFRFALHIIFLVKPLFCFN